MNISKNTKILMGILVIIIITVGGWFVFKSKGIEKRIEIKGKLEIAEGVPLFNKECMANDLKVDSFYLKGVCKKPYLAASLSGIIGEEIEVKGEAKEMEGVKVIEVEEIIPPEIIMIATDTSRYRMEDKIILHLKHYLKKSVFSYFDTEKPTCAIKSIEKKDDGNWEELPNWSQPADCAQITLKETKPYHLSGEFSMFEWQPNLNPGQYRLKIGYKLTGEDEWKTVYSNEFIFLKPEVVSECKVERGYGYDREAEKKFHKVVISEVEWNNYKNFSVKEMTIRYGYEPSPIFDEGPLTIKLISRDGKILKAFRTNDPREVSIMCEMGAHCPPSQLLEEGEQTIINFLAFYLISYPKPREFVDANDIKFIEFYEREKLPFPEGKAFPGYTPGELLLNLDLSECMKKFCDEVALENDPSCVGEYYSPSTVIKGKIIDHLGNPIKNVHIDFGEKTTTRGCSGSEYTDGNGDYIINECYQPHETKLIEGNYWLAIYPPFKLNLKSESKEVSIKKGETKILNIALKQGGSITGKITDWKGNPLTEAWVYEIGFKTPRTHVCEMPEECEPGAFVIPYLDPGDYRIGAEVKIGEKYIELPSKEAKVELGKTTVINFVLED